MLEAVNLGNRLENRIGVLRRHGVELPHALFAVHLFRGAQIRIQLVQNGVQLFVGERRINLICSIDAERKRHRRAAVQFRQPLLDVGRVADLDILRERGVGENVNEACVTLYVLYSPNNSRSNWALASVHSFSACCFKDRASMRRC